MQLKKLIEAETNEKNNLKDFSHIIAMKYTLLAILQGHIAYPGHYK